MNDFTSTTSFKYNRLGVYVKDGTSGARIEMEEAPRARPGDVVDVAGFPAVTPGKPILRNAIVRVIGSDREPVAVDLSTTNAITPESDAELVRVLGEVLSVVTTPAERVLVLKMGETVFDAGFEKSEAGDKLQQIRPGSLVSVTGVYSYQWGPPPSFRLFLRSPDDVAVLRAAPWWTMRHTAVMLVMLAVAATVSGILKNATCCTGDPTRRRNSWRPRHARRTSTSASRSSPRDTTPSSGSAATSFRAARSSGLPSHGWC